MIRGVHPFTPTLLTSAPDVRKSRATSFAFPSSLAETLLEDEYGQTPLYEASGDGHTDVVEALLAAPGVDVNKASIRTHYPPG